MAEYANTLGKNDPDSPCKGRTAPPASPVQITGGSMPWNYDCNVDGGRYCDAMLHCDIKKVNGWKDIRSYKYMVFALSPSWFQTTADYQAVGFILNKDATTTSSWPGAPNSATPLIWGGNHNGGMTFTLPSGIQATFNRLREGIERFAVTDINNPAGSAQAQSELVVMWDEAQTSGNSWARYNHVPGGVNVLFMDGHVQFAKAGDNSVWVTNEHAWKQDPAIPIAHTWPG
ncbi:MAG: hypothetical protein IT364_19705 [Candidatus Hydrogenedentes bacterium]|nr:hypothetical protein [Candidatus Hydrogenedentota bacterium]